MYTGRYRVHVAAWVQLLVLYPTHEGSPSMSWKPCEACGRTPRGKLVTLFPARFTGENQRLSYRCQRCLECAGQLVDIMKHAIESEGEGYMEWPETCPIDGVSLKEDFDPLYVTVYVPGKPERKPVLPVCTSCAAKIWPVLIEGGKEQTQRGNGQEPERPREDLLW